MTIFAPRSVAALFYALRVKCAWYHYKNKEVKQFSTRLFLLAATFCVCLIASNLFACKIFSLGPIALPGAVVVFPVSYIINDCISEVYGYKKARFTIWTAFSLNILFVLAATLVTALPAAGFWHDGESFNYVFKAAPRATLASLLAFLAGSNINALVMSRLKVRDRGRLFSKRAILSSVAGELADSLIFIPVMFWAIGLRAMLPMMAAQVVFKVCYEIAVLPLTSRAVKRLKLIEETDEYDTDISYNPFKIFDL